MMDVRVLEEDFRIPQGFKIREFFDASFGIYKSKSIREVTLRFSPIKTRWIRDQVWYREQKKRFFPDGSMGILKNVWDSFKK